MKNSVYQFHYDYIPQFFSNNFMKVAKERNPYLRRMYSNQPHKYGFQIDTGKHYLLSPDGTQRQINKIGTFKPKFRKQFTGFASPKQRVQASKNDSTAIYYTPQNNLSKQNSFYTPLTRKFVGYAQQPYRIKGSQKLQYLCNPDSPHEFAHKKQVTKSLSSRNQFGDRYHKKHISDILQHSASTFIQKSIDNKFYEQSFKNQTLRKPLPKEAKKTCYNYRCKNLKYFTFDQREKTNTAIWSKFVSIHGSDNDMTKSKSFYDRQLQTEKKEMETMKSTFI